MSTVGSFNPSQYLDQSGFTLQNKLKDGVDKAEMTDLINNLKIDGASPEQVEAVEAELNNRLQESTFESTNILSQVVDLKAAPMGDVNTFSFNVKSRKQEVTGDGKNTEYKAVIGNFQNDTKKSLADHVTQSPDSKKVMQEVYDAKSLSTNGTEVVKHEIKVSNDKPEAKLDFKVPSQGTASISIGGISTNNKDNPNESVKLTLPKGVTLAEPKPENVKNVKTNEDGSTTIQLVGIKKDAGTLLDRPELKLNFDPSLKTGENIQLKINSSTTPPKGHHPNADNVDDIYVTSTMSGNITETSEEINGITQTSLLSGNPIILIDESGSMKTEVSDLKNTIGKLVDQGSNYKLGTFIDYEKDVDWINKGVSMDANKTLKELGKTSNFNAGKTRMFESAIVSANNILKGHTVPDNTGNPIENILMFTDEGDTVRKDGGGIKEFDDLISNAQAKNYRPVVVYSFTGNSGAGPYASVDLTTLKSDLAKIGKTLEDYVVTSASGSNNGEQISWANIVKDLNLPKEKDMGKLKV